MVALQFLRIAANESQNPNQKCNWDLLKTIPSLTSEGIPVFEVGDIVTSRYGWREAFVAAPKELHAVNKAVQPRSVYLGTLGMTGITAWAGLTMVEVKAGDVIYISGAAGAVGSMAGQLAKLGLPRDRFRWLRGEGKALVGGMRIRRRLQLQDWPSAGPTEPRRA